MKTTIILAVTLILGLSVSSAEAQIARAPKARIAQGVRSGELNHREVRHLAKEQRRFRRHKHMALANDGRIGPRERRALKFEKRKMGRDVWRLKHNRF